MSPSRPFILRPIATSLMMVGVLLAAIDLQLGQNVAAMRLHGIQAEIQHVRDLLVALTFGNELQDLAFP